MGLSDLAIRRPVFTTMLAASLLVLGALGLQRLGTDLYPDVSIPFVTVTTIYPGAGPEDVEQQITRPIEDAVAGINGVANLRSTSREGYSLVFVKFGLSSDLDRVAQEVRERVSAIRRDLPEAAEEPEVARFDVGAQPVVIYSARGDTTADRVRRVLEDQLKPELEQVDGVALVRIEGGREREVRVRVDKARLDAARVPAVAVLEALRRENVNIPSGHLRQGPMEIGVRADARIHSPEDVGRIVVANPPGGSPVLVADVADVVDGFAEQRTLVRTNGGEAVGIEVIKRPGANTLEVARQVRARMEALVPGLPHGIQAAMLIDASEAVEENAHEVEVAIVYGGAMAIFVILLFLLDVRGTLISALALPTAVIGTFAVMYGLGYTLNMMTLLGLSLAIGLLIDDSVVVREAITRRLEEGEDPFTAARRGTREVGLAVLATTFTICAVFVPVAFMSGMVGQFFEQFGLTVTAAVLLSTFIALTLDPMLSARFSKVIRKGRKRFPPFRLLEWGFSLLERAYHVVLGAALRHKLATLTLAVASLVGAGALAWQLGFEFIAPEDRGRFIVNLELPPGTSLEETARQSREAELAMLGHPEVLTVSATVGIGSDVRRVRYRVNTTPKEARAIPLNAVKDAVRPALDAVPGATYAISDPPIIEGLGDWPPILMELRGPDLDQLSGHANTVARLMDGIDGIVDIDVKYSPGLPEVSVRVDRDRARARGLTAADVAIQSRIALQGEVAGQMAVGGDDVDIRVSMGEGYRRDPGGLGQLQVFGSQGPVLLEDVASLEPGSGPAAINRSQRTRSIAVWAYVADRPLGKVVRDLHAALDPLDLGPGYSLAYEGMQREMQESNSDFALALILSVLFIYMVLASQFESFAHPFTIVLSLPLSFIGAFAALWLGGLSISLGANIGLVLLMGLSTKNGILLVDGALQRMRDDGLDADAAMALAGPRRLRPILMTSAAMVLGMLPTALATGSGSEFRAPMALAVVGGVISSTFLTLLVVPAIFGTMERVSGRLVQAVAWLAPGVGRSRPEVAREVEAP